jgi:oligosaccharide repeat unit polymerase
VVAFFVAMFGLAFSAIFASRIIRLNFFHPAVWFVAFTAIDAFIPALLWSLFGYPRGPDWMPQLTRPAVASGLFYYTAYFVLFCGVLAATSGRIRAPVQAVSLSKGQLRKYSITLWLSLILAATEIVTNILEAGGVSTWLFDKLTLSGARITGEAVDANIFAILKPETLFFSMMGLLFYHRKHVRHKFAYGYAMPLIAIALALSTTFRGTVLFVIFILAFAEYTRIANHEEEANRRKALKKLRRLLALAVTGVILVMAVYGTIRNEYRNFASNQEQETSVILESNPLTVGHGLQSISHIVDEYSRSADLFYGKTYFDMLLMPIPRSIYPTKPAWYGIDDITRRMGWPQTTMTAVTMPGEAFANFSTLGLLIAIPFGALFGLLYRASKRTGIHYMLIIPALSFQMVSTTNWMSFTGFMNSLSSVLILYFMAEVLTLNTRRITLSPTLGRSSDLLPPSRAVG